MLFFSLEFLVFFSIVFLLFWKFEHSTYRKLLLLTSSYFFYAAWDYRFLGLIFFSTLLDFLVGRAIERNQNNLTRKRLLFLSLTGNLGVLFFFKYFDFFSAEFTNLMESMSIAVDPTYINVILPVGISFYTFQTLSYTIDIYRKKMPASQSLLDVGVFVAFFPQLVAGPIVRASDFFPQLDLKAKLSSVPWKACVALFLIGLFKKLVIADNLALLIEPVFSNPEQYTALSVVTAVFLFAIQIYCDFSGYSDMAIALAKLLGFNFPLNFSWPYFSKNISDFWRRWHISLSSWLRDYLYISLGGNRSGSLLRYRNLMLTMLLGGLWHGASINFIIWGALHGFALITYHLAQNIFTFEIQNRGLSFCGQLISTVVTLWWVCFCWIFFRAESLEAALTIANVYLFFQSSGDIELAPVAFIFALLMTSLHAVAYKIDLTLLAEHSRPTQFGICIGVTLSLIVFFAPSHDTPFIYFQF